MSKQDGRDPHHKKSTFQIEPFIALAGENLYYFKGRVVIPKKQSRPSAKKNIFQNMLAAFRRYSVKAISGISVKIIFGNKQFTVVSDEDGIFELKINDKSETIQNVIFCLEENNACQVVKEVFFIDSQFGVISDIDDTIVISHATNVGRKFWLSISKNAYSRRPFPGISEFYEKLTKSKTDPVFYVSSSDWSLYDLIRDFLNYRDLPPGVLFLKDKHIHIKNIWKSGGGSHTHKLDNIEFIFDLFPTMQFVLIGDSGQHDTEIYAEVLKNHPQRVRAVFVRIIDKVSEEQKELLSGNKGEAKIAFVESSHEALELAKQHGLV